MKTKRDETSIVALSYYRQLVSSPVETQGTQVERKRWKIKNKKVSIIIISLIMKLKIRMKLNHTKGLTLHKKKKKR